MRSFTALAMLAIAAFITDTTNGDDHDSSTVGKVVSTATKVAGEFVDTSKLGELEQGGEAE